MKINLQKLVTVIFFMIFTLSCTNEDETLELIPKLELTPKLELFQRAEKGVLYQADFKITKNKMYPFAIPSITGCGYGFKVNMTLFAYEPAHLFYYEIWDATDTLLINDGTVSQGANTDWVLSPCTTYIFKFWSNPWGGPTTILTGVSDGCGGLYIC